MTHWHTQTQTKHKEIEKTHTYTYTHTAEKESERESDGDTTSWPPDRPYKQGLEPITHRTIVYFSVRGRCIPTHPLRDCICPSSASAPPVPRYHSIQHTLHAHTHTHPQQYAAYYQHPLRNTASWLSIHWLEEREEEYLDK